MIWIVIIAFFIGLLIWILFGPVILFLDTETNRYHLFLPGIFKAAVVPAEGLFRIRVWIFFIPFAFNPFAIGRRKNRIKDERPEGRKGLKRRSNNIQVLMEAIRSFRIRKLHLDLDTDDFILNAWLVPVFSVVNTGNIRLGVNFEGNVSMVLDLRTRLGSLLWIFIRNKYKSFFNL